MGASYRSDIDLLRGFFEGDNGAARELRDRFDDRLLRRAGTLPPILSGLDLEDDILQRTYELVYRAGLDAFDPKRGDLISYLEGHARNAKRDACAEHAPPGEPSRPRKDTKGESIPRRPAIPLEQTMQTDAGRHLSLVETLEAPANEIENALTGIFVNQLSEQAERLEMPTVARMIGQMKEDQGIADAAAAIGVSRFAARRALDRFAFAVAS